VVRILLAGLTGQLGHGLAEVAAEHGVELVPVVRRIGRRGGAARVQRLFPDDAGLVERTLEGELADPLWGLDPSLLGDLGPVDAVLNVAADTNWSAPRRRLMGVNLLGAAHGLQVARTLAAAHGAPVLYCYAGSIFTAHQRTGRIAEERFAPSSHRTTYEHTKWLAEELLLDAEPVDGVSLLVARIGGLLGSSRTGATAKRNSLYILADRLSRSAGLPLPLPARGRVDVLPRDVAAGMLLRAVAAAAAGPAPPLVHVCAGETTHALLAALRSLSPASLRLPPTVPFPAAPLAWAAQHFERLQPLGVSERNMLAGIRYLVLDRTFERARLAALLGTPLPGVAIEEIARLVFELAAPAVAPAGADPVLARFAA
jgi:nucleoside-diphosphate-sugar epimerase